MINKSIILVLALISALVMGVSSCKDDTLGYTADEGDEVHFGVILDSPHTRTHYGEELNNKVPIYWNMANDAGVSNDTIFIFAPNALAGRNSAYYEVKPDTEQQSAASQVDKVGDTGVQWGSGKTQFYGFYPGNKNFNLTTEGTTITATLPAVQSVTYKEKIIDNTESAEPFHSVPDMSNMMMIAKTADIDPANNETVSLQFTPFSTVLDITINGPKQNNLYDPIYVTSVKIESNQQICGRFSYDFNHDENSNGITLIPSETPEADKSIVISTLGDDGKGNLVGIPLHGGQKLNLKAFLIPNISTGDLIITVTTNRFRDYSKTISLTGNNVLKPHQIHRIELPKINADQGVFNYETWLGQLDPNIYISEISLPGSALSFNTKEHVGNVSWPDAYITQSALLEEQFKNGVRVFQGHIWTSDINSTIEGVPAGTKKLEFVTSGYGQSNPTGFYLSDVIERLSEQMQGVHSQGFCVLCLSDYPPNNPDWGTFYNSLYEIANYFDRLGLLASNIGPETTLREVRGKVLLKFQLNGGKYENGILTSQYRDEWNKIPGNTNSLFNIYLENAESNPLYSPLTFDTYPSQSDEAYGFCSLDGLTSIKGKNIDINITKNMWYIYAERANLDTRNKYNYGYDNIKKVVDIIADKYDKNASVNNKFFMTYCGGTGNSYDATLTGTAHTPSTIATNFANRWKDLVTTGNTFKQIPYGWVLFNFAAGQNDAVNQAIREIIEHNNDPEHLLKRKPLTSSFSTDARKTP